MISAEAFLAAHGTCETPVVEPGVDSPRRGTWSHGNRPARRSARSHVAAWAGAGGSLRCRCVSGVRIAPAGCGGSSIGRLRDRLIDKGYDDETVAAVVDRLIEVGLVDDESYAQSAVRYCVGRLMGYRGAVMELARKGVDRPLAERVCDEARMSGVFEDAHGSWGGAAPPRHRAWTESAQAPVLVLGRAQGARRRNCVP